MLFASVWSVAALYHGTTVRNILFSSIFFLNPIATDLLNKWEKFWNSERWKKIIGKSKPFSSWTLNAFAASVFIRCIHLWGQCAFSPVVPWKIEPSTTKPEEIPDGKLSAWIVDIWCDVINVDKQQLFLVPWRWCGSKCVKIIRSEWVFCSRKETEWFFSDLLSK